MTNVIDELRTAQRQIRTVANAAAQLRSENRYLRSRLADNGRGGRILRRAYDDGMTMVLWRYSGIYPSRSWCLENGLSERRWAWARALLMAARVHDGRDIVDGDIDTIRRSLHATYQRLRGGDDEDLIQLRARMPRKYHLVD